MIKKLTILSLLLLLLLPIKTDAEIAILLHLQDDDDQKADCIVREGGDYFIDFGRGRANAQGSGTLVRIGDFIIMTDVTPFYEIVVTGNVRNQTGKARLRYFGVLPLTILDQTANAQD